MNLPAILHEPSSVLASFSATVTSMQTRMKAELATARVSKKKAAELRITNDQEFEKAAAQLQSVLRRSDELEAERTRFTKPINDLLKQINGAFNPTKKEWDSVAELAKMATLAYMQARELAAQAAAAAAERLSNAVPVIGTTPAAQQYQALAAHGAQAAPTVSGITSVGTWTWELVDIRQVPPQLKFEVVDEKQVNALVQQWKEKLVVPGLRIFRADHLSVRRQ